MLRRLALLTRLGTIVLTRSTNKPLREIVTVSDHAFEGASLLGMTVLNAASESLKVALFLKPFRRIPGWVPPKKMPLNGQPETLWALGVYFIAVLLLVGAMLAISYVLGERHNEHATGQTYESGILSEGEARIHVSVKFYQVAMFFVIFDLEAVFIVAWAIAARELRWAGYCEILVFNAILFAALAYLWRVGALDWGPSRRATSARH